ncbi:MAG: alpha-mannosidase, partial [Acidimicrobiales bacterium]
RRLADTDGVPHLVMEGPREFFTAAEADLVDPPVWVGELYLELHRGTYTSQAATKRGNRRAEFALRDLELWTSLAPSSSPAPDELDGLWKLLLLHQFHDIIPGSGIHWVYEDTARDHAHIIDTANDLVDDALAAHVTAIDTTSAAHPVVLFNSLSHPRRTVIALEAAADVVAVIGPDGESRAVQRTADGQLLCAVTVPPCGYQVIDLLPGSPSAPVPGPGPVSTGTRFLENEHLRVELDDDGLLSSIEDKDNHRQVLAPGTRGNRFQLHPDYPNFYDAWDIDRFALDRVDDLDEAESIETVESGPVRAGIRIVRRFGSSMLTQVVSLEAGSRLIDFTTEVEWHETNRLLKVAFPVDVHSRRATYEIQYGHVERPTHANTSWDVARFEVCAHKWADLSEPGYGVALLNDCKYGHDIAGNVIRLSLLRAPTWPDPEADRGHHVFRYQLLPHAGDLRSAGVIDAGYDLNVPVRAVATDAHTGSLPGAASLLSVDAPNVVIEVVKRSDDGAGDLVLRLYEAWGRRGDVVIRAPWDLDGASVTDMLERRERDVATDGARLTLALTPFEIATVKLVRAGPGA